MDSVNRKIIGVFVNALTGEEIIRDLTPDEIASLPKPIELLEQ
jgi:hypothetical protein